MAITTARRSVRLRVNPPVGQPLALDAFQRFGGALDLDVPQVYSCFASKGITNHGEMARCIRCASSYGHADRVIDEPAEWPGRRYLRSFGFPAHHESLAWFQHVRMAIDAGYYGLAMVDFDAACGPETNHWVLLAGARTDTAKSGGVLTGEVFVSCSVRGGYWIEARQFLKTMGGYDALFVRPRTSRDGDSRE